MVHRLGWPGVAALVGASLLIISQRRGLAQGDGSHQPDETAQADGDRDHRPESPRAPAPEAAKLMARPQGAANDFPGVFLLGQAIELTPEVDARVESVEVRMGDVVQQGQVVAQLDRRKLDSELAIAVARHAVARAELELARIDLEESRRVRDSRIMLRRDSLITQDELDLAKHRRRRARSDCRVAAARAAETAARVEEVRQRLNDTRIVAPFDGIVGERFVEPGAMIGPDRPILRIVSTSVPRVRFAVPEELAARVVVGLAARISLTGTEGQFSGVISHVAPELDLASSMLFAEVEFDAAAQLTRLGGRPVRVYLDPVGK